MARRKIIPDARVLAATSSVIARIGPVDFTLAHVAEETGLSPATLVQRFGSKRRLLLAVVAQGAADVDEYFQKVRARHWNPAAALLDAAEQIVAMAETPESLAKSLVFQQMNETDPEFHALALERSRAVLAGYEALLNETAEMGQLIRRDTARLAKALVAVSGGSVQSWAIAREGSVKKWLRRDVETLLGPYMPHLKLWVRRD